jgi:putative hemolysin
VSDSEILYLVLIFLCLLLSFFFSSSETAFFYFQKIRLQHLIDNRVKGAELVAKLTGHPEKLLSTILLGNNLVNVAAASLATVLAVSASPKWGVLIATAGTAIMLLVFCETVPKTMAVRHAERLSLTFARPVQVVSWLFSPFVFLLSRLASGFTTLLGGAPVSSSLVSEKEIRSMISVGHREGTIEEDAAEMLRNIFDFGDRPVGEVMIPRTEVVFVEQGIGIADFLSLYEQFPLSRYPVFREKRDNVVGILSIKDVLMAQAKGSITDKSLVDEFVRPPYFTPETKPISKLFAEMRDNNHHMAVVIDEFGGTAGVVSVSRLIEEIVGPLGDEMVGVEKDFEVINDYTFQIDGGMRVEEANDELGLGLPSGSYETVAGLILHLLQRIPKQGEQLRYKDLKLVITKMLGVKIEEVLVTKEKPAITGPHKAPPEESRNADEVPSE